MVNINIAIDDKLHKKIKVKCAIEDVTLKEFVIKSLEKKLNET